MKPSPLTTGTTEGWRIKVPDETITFNDKHYGRQSLNLAREWGDFIVRRSDGIYAYQLAVVIDDALMGVTEVIRGRDLLSSSAPQLYLYRLLGFKPPQFGHLPLLTAPDGRRLAKRDLGFKPPQFGHLPLLTAPDGRRLAKRDMDLDMGALRSRYTPEEVIGRLAFLAGLIDKEEPVKASELLPLFDWKKIPKENITVTN